MLMKTCCRGPLDDLSSYQSIQPIISWEGDFSLLQLHMDTSEETF